MTNQKEQVAKSPSGRVRRTPLGQRQVLSVRGKDPNFEYRIVNDTGDRVQRFLDAGWENVPADQIEVGDKRINSPSPEGSKAQVSVGQGLKAYVLRIKKEWYEEDQAAKQAEVNRIEEATRKDALNGNYGKLEVTRD
jgi:hypothetical protein